MKQLFAIFVLGSALSACSSGPSKPVDNATSVEASVVPDATSKAISPAVTETEAQRIDRIVKKLASRSIYFDYDDFAIKPEYQAVLAQDFELLKSAPTLQIRIEGNADERGSREYNLALGQKRAEAVRRTLILLGAADAQLEAVSYGSERPKADCHEERCWAENRRADFSENNPSARN